MKEKGFALTDEQFEHYTQATYRKVYPLALKLVGSVADAEDLTQEAYVRAYRNFHKYQGERPFENWVLRILQRLFLDFLRYRSRRVKTVSYNAPLNPGDGESDFYYEIADRTYDPELLLLKNKLGEELQAALSELTPDQQYLVALADLQGKSYSDIAEEFGVPIGTVRSRLHRAHKTLRARVERWERENPNHLANLQLTTH